MLKILLQTFLIATPWPLRRRLLQLVFGYHIAPSARIGLSLILADKCELEEGARIGHFTLVKGLSLLRIDAFGRLGKLNWVTGFPLGTQSRHFAHFPDRFPSLKIGAHAAVTNRHILDCTDAVTVGPFATLGGFRTQILTHSIDLQSNMQSCSPISIGEYSFVGTACVLLKGTSFPAQSVLGAGSVLTKTFEEPGLYGGVPARYVAPISDQARYFNRDTGYVY